MDYSSLGLEPESTPQPKPQRPELITEPPKSKPFGWTAMVLTVAASLIIGVQLGKLDDPPQPAAPLNTCIGFVNSADRLVGLLSKTLTTAGVALRDGEIDPDEQDAVDKLTPQVEAASSQYSLQKLSCI